MRSLINTDIFRYTGGTSLTHCWRAWRYPGFRYSYFFRKIEGASAPARWFYQIMQSVFCSRSGYWIARGAKIGRGIYLSHYGNVVVNGRSVIGDNCNLGHFITIGKTHRGRLKGAPVIGNRVWIGTGAVVVGGIEIGDDVLIAPNAYVNFSVPSGSLVIGNPGKIIARAEATEGYITNLV
jgi:serine O-acetyltransferase